MVFHPLKIFRQVLWLFWIRIVVRCGHCQYSAEAPET